MLRPADSQIAQLMELALVADHLPGRCPAGAAYRLMDLLGLPNARLADWGLSFHRSKSRTAVLGRTETKRIYRAAAAWIMADRVFADVSKAQRFLNSPHPFLAGRSPVDVTGADENGLKSVEALLGRLYFGTAA